MKLVPTESGILTYKMSGRYNLDWMEENMVEHLRQADTYLHRPTKLLVPAWLVGEALTVLNAEFDKQYAMTMRRVV